MSNRLAGLLPLSKLAANLVARLMRSGKLVRLPRCCSSITASMSRRGGRLIADKRLNPREILASGSTTGDDSDNRLEPRAPATVAALKGKFMSSELGRPFLMVGRALEDLVEAGTSANPSENGFCTGAAVGRVGESCVAGVGVTVVTNAAFPLRPRLALLTS